MACDSFQASSASDELRISSVFSVSGNSNDAVSGESTKLLLFCPCRTSLFVIGFTVDLKNNCCNLTKVNNIDLNIYVFASK